MTLVVRDLVFETTSTTGTSAYSLIGPVAGYRSFGICGNGAKVPYIVTDGAGGFEIGIGTVTTGTPNTLARTTILASSNTDAAVNWGTGTRNIRLAPLANTTGTKDENLNFVDYFGIATGTGNQQILTLNPAPKAYSDGMMIAYRVGTTNTGTTVTVNVNSLGAKQLKINGVSPLIGQLVAGRLIVALYKVADNTFEIINPLGELAGQSRDLTIPINFKKGADIASAATCDIGAATGNYVTITGTTTITALGTAQAGTTRKVVFDSALTLTHNATSLILKTGANIVTAAGDTTEFVSEGGGNWRMLDYQRANGQALSSPVTQLSSYYASPAQTITSGGVLTLAHGLSAPPKLVKASLVCVTAEAGYPVGAELDISLGALDANGRISMAQYDATNIYIRYSSSSSVFAIGNTAGSGVAITNANWRLYVKAWA